MKFQIDFECEFKKNYFSTMIHSRIDVIMSFFLDYIDLMMCKFSLFYADGIIQNVNKTYARCDISLHIEFSWSSSKFPQFHLLWQSNLYSKQVSIVSRKKKSSQYLRHKSSDIFHRNNDDLFSNSFFKKILCFYFRPKFMVPPI